MPTNFQNAANQLRNRVQEQYQAPPVAAVPLPVADPDIPRPLPPQAVGPPAIRPPIIDRGDIVPVDRGDIRGQIDAARVARQAAQGVRKAERVAARDARQAARIDRRGVVPVDRGQMQAWIQSLRDRMGPGREAAVRGVLGNPNAREAAAKVGGAVLGRMTAEQAAQQAAAQQAQIQQQRAAAMAQAEAARAAAEQQAAAARAAATSPLVDRQQQLQQFVSGAALPSALGTRLSGLLGR